MRDHEVGSLVFSLPAGYEETNRSEEVTPSPIPVAPPTTEHFAAFTHPGGGQLFVYYWDGPPLRDLGPMSEKESWPASVVGSSTRIIETEMFMGHAQEVLVAHIELGLGDGARGMIFGSSVGIDLFREILGSFRIGLA